MVDHILLDVIAALREALEGSLLEQLAVEERFQVDVFLGDISFETSYSLPGEGQPPRVRADIGLEWPTWSQSAYRSWSIGEPPVEQPELVLELTLRLQRLAELPERDTVLAALNGRVPSIAGGELGLGEMTIEQTFEGTDAAPSFAVNIVHNGTIKLTEAMLDQPESLTGEFAPVGSWVASSLVRLADLNLPFLPAADPQSDPGP